MIFDPSDLPANLLARLEGDEAIRIEPFHAWGCDSRERILSCAPDHLERLGRERAELRALHEAWLSTLAPPARPRVMGVLNVTPDSFSDGGLYLDAGLALAHGRRMSQEGAELIDVGGESTRPGAQPVSPEEELRRITGVVRGLADEGIAVSIDTRRAVVARAALDAGAVMINDVSGGLFDPDMLPLAAERGCELVLMHAQGDPRTMQADPRYGDPVADVARHLHGRVQAAREAGVDPSRIYLDPGIGFGKRLEHNLALLARLGELRSLGYPLLVGVSRKSFIAHITGAERQDDWRSAKRRDRPEERLGGTAAAVTASVLGGAELLRVHDVGVMSEVIAVARALLQAGFSGLHLRTPPHEH